MNVLGIDIGGTNFRLGIVREDLSLAKYEKVPTPSVFRSGDVLGDLAEMFLRHGKAQALADFIDGMACAAAAEINILDPDHVLLGGGVLNMKGFPRVLFDEKLREHTRKPLPWQELKPVYTGDEPDKSVVGGAIYARRKLVD